MVAVHDVSAVTFHAPFVEWHIVKLAALATHLAAGRETVDGNHSTATQRGFVFDHLPQCAKSGIADRAGKVVVFHPNCARSLGVYAGEG